MPVVANIVTSLAGRAVAQTIGGAAAGPVGMVLGAALPFVARRLGPLGMVGLAVGAWAVGKLLAAQAEKGPILTLPLPDLEKSPDPTPHPGSDLVAAPR
jgi:hypothetical protein